MTIIPQNEELHLVYFIVDSAGNKIGTKDGYAFNTYSGALQKLRRIKGRDRLWCRDQLWWKHATVDELQIKAFKLVEVVIN